MRTTRNGLIALLAVGGYFAWRNREQILDFINNRGETHSQEPAHPMTRENDFPMASGL